MNRKIILGTALAASLFTTGAMADGDRIVEYRQSAMTLIGANFMPIGDMLKGERPWDAAAAGKFARDLAAVAGIDQLRGYPEGSDKGHTKAKPEIWSNWDDFKGRMEEFQQAAAELGKVGDSGDQGLIGGKFKEVAKSCKGCHKEYKSKEHRD